ncbi:hypothetical protein LNKW23_03400 [Paralimibaculum aggregatum]|uniref:Protein-export membrane protein SecG n=1 Tax=Paralimibaculum aggregatum TaxID=3036245 RepID=A0ABQ6LK18_9RHOB|nr:preprotein translocase subunit SecG [Limibaculum sp. NKW23]GMG81128.1 hypothetical protein LNKW23_03400 [Limibaculum sp. NKW23]
MENVLLIIHLIIAVCLIGAVLLQRSEGGALGIGGGGGGMVSSRSAATALAKLTWGLAAAFIATSITLAVLAGGNPTARSVIDEVPVEDGSGGIILPELPPADDGAAGAGGAVLPGLPAADGGAAGAPEPAPAEGGATTPPTAD